MNRELKFRLYFHDKELNRLQYSTHRFEVTDKRLHIMLASFEGNTIKGFVQFTGIKDKNGKEIYEGDIIMFLDRDWMDYEKDTKRLPVVYEEDKFIIKGGEDKYGQYYEYPLFKSYGRDRFEVIGNIYQNPELITVSPAQIQPPKTGAQEP